MEHAHTRSFIRNMSRWIPFFFFLFFLPVFVFLSCSLEVSSRDVTTTSLMNRVVDQLETSATIGSPRQAHKLFGYVRSLTERISGERRPTERVAATRRAVRAWSEVVVERDATFGEALGSRVAARACHAEEVSGAVRVLAAKVLVMGRGRGVLVVWQVVAGAVGVELLGEWVATRLDRWGVVTPVTGATAAVATCNRK